MAGIMMESLNNVDFDQDREHIIDNRNGNSIIGSFSRSVDFSTCSSPDYSSSSDSATNHNKNEDNGDNIDDEIPLPVKEACKLVASHRATEVALHTLSQMLEEARDSDKFGSAVRDLTAQETELRILNDQSKLKLLRLMDTMESSQKLEFLFLLVDLDQSKNITAIELAKILQLIGGHGKPFNEALKAAQLTITANDKDGDGCLDFEEFDNFVESMGDFLEKTTDEIAHYLIMEITSMYNGTFIIEETLDCDQFQHKTAFYKKMSDFEKVRIYIIFQLLDSMTTETGCIKFRHVIEAMAPISKHMDKEFRMMLFFVDEDKYNETMMFPQFLQFVENAMAACPPELTVDHIANVMTKHLASTKSRILPSTSSTLSNDDESIDFALSKHRFSGNSQSINSNNEQPNALPQRDYQDKQRIRHLFNLWDKDKTQTLDVEELFMGFRKFQKAQHMDETMADVEDAIQAVQRQQQDQQQGDTQKTLEGDKITVDQFEEIMAHLAIGVHVELHKLIDFMYMQTVVHENHKEETDHHAMELKYAAQAAEHRRNSYTKSKSKYKALTNLFGLSSSNENSKGELLANSFSKSFNLGGSSSSMHNITRTDIKRSFSEGVQVQLSSRQLVNSGIRPSHSDSMQNEVKTVNLWASVRHHFENLRQEEISLPTEECPRTA